MGQYGTGRYGMGRYGMGGVVGILTNSATGGMSSGDDLGPFLQGTGKRAAAGLDGHVAAADAALSGPPLVAAVADLQAAGILFRCDGLATIGNERGERGDQVPGLPGHVGIGGGPESAASAAAT